MIDYAKIPPNIKEGLQRHLDRKPVGHFLTAVFSNDLFEAVGRADSDSLAALDSICSYIYCKMPSDCWGSKQKVHQWLTSGGEHEL